MALTKVTRSMIKDSVFNVVDYGATGDGITNDRLAIKATIDAAAANGGGTVLFPKGTYIISGYQATVNIPEIDGTLQYANSSYQVQIYVQSVDNINFKFDGAVLKSTKTDGGITLVFDGCNNLTFYDLNMLGATVMSGTTVTTTGTGGIAFISLSESSQNITLHNTRIADHYGHIDFAGDPTSSYRVRNVTLTGSTYLSTGYYGVSCRGNGENILVENLYSYQLNRGFFIYDTQQVSITGTIDFLPTSGFSPLVKAYTSNTRNIKLNCVFKNKANSVTPRLNFETQHNPAVQPTPAYLQDIFVVYTEEAAGNGGVGILFEYYRNSTSTATSSDFLFGDITFVGKSNNTLSTNVTITSTANVGRFNLDAFVASNGAAILNNTGFVGATQFSYTPEINFGGGTTGIAYTSRTGRYYIQGGMCTVIGEITLSNKGSSAGAAQLILPFYTREDSILTPLVTAIGAANMSGLGGALQGYVQASSNQAILFTQGATGSTSVTNSNFTNTSQLLFMAVYPV